MAKKYLLFDSGALINFTINGLIDVFRGLRDSFEGEFIILNEIKYETIDHPLKIKRFEWGALRVKNLLDDEVIKLAENERLADPKQLFERTRKVMEKANSCISSGGEAIHLIDKAEAECLALSGILTEKGIENAVVIDERTARMLCENPDNLKKLMEKKLETPLKIDKKIIRDFLKIKVLRSTELAYIAHKKGLLDGEKLTMEAVLYALKFGGCSISEKEVQMMKNL